MIHFIYNFIIILFFPVVILIYFFRYLLGKEDKERILEKFGIYAIERKATENLIWFHACSVGEAKSIFLLVQYFLQNNYNILITSNTKVSSTYIKENLPDKVVHQFLPLDYQFLVRRFINYWRPSIGVFVESEIWPNLIQISIKKKIPLCLIQAAFSNKSIKRWLLLKNFFLKLMRSFRFIVAQSNEDKKKIFEATNIKITDVLNMKLSSKKLSVNLQEKKKIKNSLKNHKIVSALSTHLGEEEILIETYNKIKKSLQNIVFFIQPRHPHRKNEIVRIFKEKKIKYKIRSKLEYPDKNTDIYLCDTFGESGNLISVSDLIILGGTLVPIGGHNLIEPAQFGKCIICGNFYAKIKDLVDLFKKEKAVLISESVHLDNLIKNLLTDNIIIKDTGYNAKKITTRFQNPEKYLYNKIRYLIENNENSRILV